MSLARSFSVLFTEAADEQDKPKELKLDQNYPNPFNPLTIIQYSLPAKGFVSLRVYDLTGREAATLDEQ